MLLSLLFLIVILLLQSALEVIVHYQGKTDQEFQAGTECETLEKHSLLALSPPCSAPVFYVIQDHRPTGDTAMDMPIGQSAGGISSFEAPSFQVTLNFCQVDTK